jgi:L-ectoine synthase
VIVRRTADLIGTDRDVDTPNWVSRRLLLAKDRTGFSMHETTMRAGTETFMWYANHVEAVYCVGGEGTLEDVTTGEIHPITDGTLYCLDGHEQHVMRPETDMRLICVFNPPVTGREVHDERGVYPLLTEEPDGPAEAAAEGSGARV